MKLDVSKLPIGKLASFDEEVDFPSDKYPRIFPLLDVIKTQVHLDVVRFDECINVNVKITSEVTLQCSYSLKPFNKVIKGDDEVNYTSLRDNDDDSLIEFSGNIINMDEYLYSLLSAIVPLKPIAPGAKLPSDGKGYRVLTEMELEKEKENATDHRFDILDNLDL